MSVEYLIEFRLIWKGQAHFGQCNPCVMDLGWIKQQAKEAQARKYFLHDLLLFLLPGYFLVLLAWLLLSMDCIPV